MPAISVIIPVYNKIRYLRSLLEQLQAQTFADYECLLIDDGSTDGSGQVCDEFAAQDSRLRVFHIPNGGVSHARNLGLDHAQGDYITFLDADDRIHSGYLENLHALLSNSSADLAISGILKFCDDELCGEMVSRYQGQQCMETILTDFALEQRRCGIYGSCVAKMFPRELVRDLRFDEQLCLAEDFDFYLRLYARIGSVVFDQKKYYYYLQAAENSSVQIADDQIDYPAQLQISLRYRSFLKQKNSYEDSNRQIVDSQITSFLFLSLFYCPKEKFADRFRMLWDIFRDEKLDLQPQNWKQHIVLGLFRRNAGSLLSLTIHTYHATRKIIRRMCDG